MNGNNKIANPVNNMCLSLNVSGQAGFTLLELMIALSLGLLLLLGIGTIYVGSNQTYRVQEENARLQESGRFALEFLGRNFRNAGYPNIGPDIEKTTFTGVAVNGLNGVCPTASPTTDLATIQYDGIENERDCQGDVIADGEFVQHSFFVLDNALRCNAVRATAAPTPPTVCPAAGVGVEVLPNVEDFQILYGIDTNGDQSANQYVASPANWNQVVSVRACVLLRSESSGISTTQQRYLNCANALTGSTTLTTAADSRLRRAFTATFNLRNRVNLLP